MIRTIAVFTGTRSEYGLLRPIMQRLAASEVFDLQLIVGAGHTAAAYGQTIDDILQDGFSPALTLTSDYVGSNTAMDFNETHRELTPFFQDDSTKPDCLIVLGDRHESFAAACAAALCDIPIAHIHGGDVTEGGSLDDTMRHAITKLAHLHFAATQESADRLLQLAEEAWRVNVVGAPAVENMLQLERLSREELAHSLQLDSQKKWLLVTHHPTDAQSPWAEITEVFNALQAFLQDNDDFEVLVTGVNQDAGGAQINEHLGTVARAHPSIHFVQNLGTQRYLSFLSEAWGMLGNSSSALLEAACFGLPALNIGDRQQGRERGSNVMDVAVEGLAILAQLTALKTDSMYYARYANANHPFGEGDTSCQILAILEQYRMLPKRQIRQKKWMSVHKSAALL